MSGMRVRIGPAVDRRAFDQAFARVAGDAKRQFETEKAYAKQAGDEQLRQERRTSDALARERGRRFKALERETEKWRRQEVREAEQAAQKIQRAEERAARERVAAEKRAQAQMERARQQAIRDHGRMYTKMLAQAKAAQRERDAYEKFHPRFAASIGHGVSIAGGGIYGAGMAALRYGIGVAGDVARAYGVNTSMATAMSRNADMDTLATQITNEAHEKGNKYADPERLKEQAFDIGTKTGTGANEIMGAFQGYVGKTGDLNTAQQSMLELAKISKATGSSLEDVVNAAADVGNQLGQIPDKGKKVNEIMRIMAGESKLGAVPMRALASQMSKVVSQAQLMEGDVGKNMGLLGAVAQEARLKGGAASPQQAATAVQSLMNTFGKGARVHAFDKYGISLVGAQGKQRNIENVIVESLQKTQLGNAKESGLAFSSLFADVRAHNAVRGFETTFRNTYETTQGSKQEKIAAASEAVRAEFKRLQDAAMDQTEVDESFARAMKTGQSQAEIWNNQTQKAAAEMQKALLPALVHLTPKVVAAAGAFSDIIDMLMGKKKEPDPTALRDDMDAVHKALKAPGGKVDAALVNKAIADSQKLGEQAQTLETEARGLKEHRTANVAAHGAMAAWEQLKEHPSMLLTGGAGFAGGMLGNIFSGKASKAADTEQTEAARKAKEASDESAKAFRELMGATLRVHIVSSDVAPGGGGAAAQSTDQLSQRPSGH